MTEFNKKIAIYSATAVLFIAIFIGFVALQSYLVMVIWNSVIINKFPDAKIEELTFWDALLLMIFVDILFPHTIIYTNSVARNLN